jgi:ribosome-associated protein
MIEITEELSIPQHELTFAASRSSGPGGQHVNKVSSRVTLRFDVVASPSLSDEQKRRILSRLATRVSKNGVLRVVSQKHRSQAANRRAAVERFVTLLRDALAPAPLRKPTVVLPAAKQRRLEEKRRRSWLKRQRTQKVAWDE